MTHSFRLLAAGAAVVALAACNADKGTANTTASTNVAAVPVAPPANGDWSTVVSATPEGGFVMGNPNAKVKLIEFGSMTCPHCAEFEEQGGQALIARCGGPASFFGLTRAFYANQQDWVGKIQSADPKQMEALQNLGPQAQFKALSDIAGFPAFAAMRGVPKAKTEACLADPAAATQLVQMNSDAVSNFNVQGTPSFAINGQTLENTASWAALEPKLKEALGS